MLSHDLNVLPDRSNSIVGEYLMHFECLISNIEYFLTLELIPVDFRTIVGPEERLILRFNYCFSIQYFCLLNKVLTE